MSVVEQTLLLPEQLRWRFDDGRLPFATTAEVDPAQEVFGQETAQEAMLFGLQCHAPGQNIYIRGVRGTGRQLLVHRLLRELNLQTANKRDRGYVHHFRRPDRPRLVSLAAGQGIEFKRRMAEVAQFIQEGLAKALEAEPHASARATMRSAVQQQVQTISEPFERELAENGLGLATVQHGDMTIPAIFPLVDGEAVPPEQFRERARQGQIPNEKLEQFEAKLPEFQSRMQGVAREISEAIRQGTQRLQEYNRRLARELLAGVCDRVVHDFPGSGVREFIEELIQDVVERRLEAAGEDEPEAVELYGVNVVVHHDDPTSRPVVEELAPNLVNLLGSVEPKWSADGAMSSDYRGIRGGALLHADQGFLILHADDVLAEPGAWRALMRTLRTGQLEMVPPEVGWMRPPAVVQPEPIAIQVRVILIGDHESYAMLDHYDADFRDLFKVLADFDSQIERSDEGAMQYAAVLSRLSRDESLLPFGRGAVGRLIEHGARIVARGGKLTARFGRIADIAREAAFIACQAGRPQVEGDDVREAVRRTKRRASLPSRRFQELVENRTIIVQTMGSRVGQINGLAVMQAGPLTYGFPARITATIGAGRAGLIDIEGSARLSGEIHTKAFYILGGLLRHLLPTSHPLAFSASLTFEQSYGMIDGDSASCAEICCLLSALTDVPLKQNLALTGAIDQHGNVQAIGGVNEKIEGFYDVCEYFGLTGDQGVVIPRANAADLMLREDVVEAAREGQFHLYAVENVYEALELLTGLAVGRFVNGRYLPGTLLYFALEKSHEYWRRSLAVPMSGPPP